MTTDENLELSMAYRYVESSRTLQLMQETIGDKEVVRFGGMNIEVLLTGNQTNCFVNHQDDDKIMLVSHTFTRNGHFGTFNVTPSRTTNLLKLDVLEWYAEIKAFDPDNNTIYEKICTGPERGVIIDGGIISKVTIRREHRDSGLPQGPLSGTQFYKL